MSSNSTFTSSSSFSFSSSSTNSNGETTGHRSVHQTSTDPVTGTTVQSSTQNLGEPEVRETRHYDSQGRELLEGSGGANSSRRIEDVSDSQAERDAQYEERMEDEYAKREGGA